MANEATLIFETEVAIPFTVANATGIERGAVLKQTDPMTAIINSGSNDVCAGIAAGEKIASDGRTKLEVYRGGIFKVIASGSVAVGDPLVTDTSVNHFKKQPNYNTISGANIFGYALETASTGETFLMELRPTKVVFA